MNLPHRIVVIVCTSVLLYGCATKTGSRSLSTFSQVGKGSPVLDGYHEAVSDLCA